MNAHKSIGLIVTKTDRLLNAIMKCKKFLDIIYCVNEHRMETKYRNWEYHTFSYKMTYLEQTDKKEREKY